MKNSLINILVILIMVLCSCATNPVITDPSNYRSKLKIEKKDYKFFNGQYTGTEKDCFPPPHKRICKQLQTNLYKPTKELNIEVFEIALEDTIGHTSAVVKELVHLTASDLALQRGFSMFTITHVFESSSCGSYYSANTYGSLHNNKYSGSTYLKENVLCANLYSIEVLLFNNQEEIDQGIFYHINSGISADKSNYIYPFRSLYNGTIPGELDKVETSGLNLPNSNVHSYVPTNAWKTYYEAKGLARALRDKYNIDEKESYSFINEKEKHKQQKIEKESNLLEKFKIER